MLRLIAKIKSYSTQLFNRAVVSLFTSKMVNYNYLKTCQTITTKPAIMDVLPPSIQQETNIKIWDWNPARTASRVLGYPSTEMLL